MGAGGKRRDFGVSSQAEEEYLCRTLEVVKRNVESYSGEVARMQENIDEMLAHYHDNDVEVLTILNNTVTMHEHMKRALMRNEKARNKPYFGRIIFRDEKSGREESLYIGRGGISKDATHQVVVDWRAPVANAYYENNLGKCSYTAPGGVEIGIDLERKRTYEIEGGKLLDFFDSEVIANDELLTKYLAKNKQAVLGEIVATIQKEQNEIIRKSPYHNVIVQGVAGSGKTTVAMHRISFILYNYAERFRPEDFYIVGSNRILLNYITGVLPDLDVYGVRQMTMEQLFVRLLYEDWDEKKYRIKAAGKTEESFKGSSLWFRDLEAYCQRIEGEAISRENVYLNPGQFVEGFRDGKAGVYDETGGQKADRRSLICLLKGEAAEAYIRENPSVSVQNKINMLNERLLGKVKEEFLGRGISYSEAEQKAILKAYRGWYGGRSWKRPVFEMYRDFLKEQAEKGFQAELPVDEFDVYDLAALAYLYKRIKEVEVISEASHVVIDEAQDFGMMAYHVLKFCINRCTYTVMGDVSQNIHFGFGLNGWEELRELLLPDAMDSFGVLRKSYRNTVEISDFATNILKHGRFSIYPVEPIIRHGNPVVVKELPGKKALIKEAAQICRSWQERDLDTIAVICRNQEEAEETARFLSEHVAIMESNLEKAEFGKGIMVLPVEYTKGLEFDAVLILHPTREGYPTDDGHARLLYVAATRALHELCVLHCGNLTGLIADPAPERENGNAGKTVQERGKGTAEGERLQRKRETRAEYGQERGKEPMAERWQARKKYAVAKPAAGGQSAGNAMAGSVSHSAETAFTGTPVSGIIRPRKRPSAILAKPVTPEDKKPFISRQAVRPSAYAAAKPSGSLMNAAGKNSVNQQAGVDSAAYGKKGTEPEAAMPTAVMSATTTPTAEALRPPGHGKIDLSVRWVMGQPDGLYIQSRYGTLRLFAVDSKIIRVTFAKGASLSDRMHPGIAACGGESAWMYKESGNVVEFLTDELCLRVNKGNGGIHYLTRDKKLLLAEREKECRQIEETAGGNIRGWLYLDWQKKEGVYAPGVGSTGISLRGSAQNISHKKENPAVILSEQGYGIVLAADTAVFCDIPLGGPFLYMENKGQMDFYFVAGKGRKEIEEACGRLIK